MGHSRPHRGIITKALIALLAGLLLYLVTRDPQTIAFARILPFTPGWKPLPCPVCGALPSLLHVYAFILISAYVLQPTTRQQLLSICLAWSGIEAVFELGQLDGMASLYQSLLPHWLEENPLLSLTGDYFVRGTFDPLDLLCIGLGALAAYGSLLRGIAPEVTHDQKPLHNPFV